MRQPLGRSDGANRYRFWSLPARVKIPVLVVEAVVVGALAAGIGAAFVHGTRPAAEWVWLALALVVAGVASTEASLGVERKRRQSDDHPHLDLSSVWTFAGAVLLVGPLAALVAMAIYLHIYLRVWRRNKVPLHRVLFSTATILLAVQAAAAVTDRIGNDQLFHSVAGVLAVVAAMVVYMLVNLALVVLVIVVSGPSRRLATVRQAIGPFDDVALEFATLAMGALVAAAADTFGPPYVLLGLPPLIVLHRTRLVRQLEEDASTDGKTGLLTAAAWQEKAGRAVLRSERGEQPTSVLVLDLDHFKLVNDRFGHLVGDQVLAAVAASVRDEVRDEDLVGRFGGEEFVVLLQGAEREDPRSGARAVAERIRERIAALRVAVAGPHETVVVEGLTVSIGGATAPRDGNDLAALLEIADAAMYEAKRAGRNLVRMGLPVNAPKQLRRADRA
ncbi:MAG TPA: GGDEF domain-containing protein [Pseudonocardia sp.]|nr:GGDEF domain-containing protein [Pseudonocardia sp.]